MSVTAALLINSIRDEISDPVFSGSTPQPDTDGSLFRSQTLLNWLSRGVKEVARRTGWSLTDWFASPMIAGQPVVVIDQKWMQYSSANANQWQLRRMNEAYTIYPARPTGSQPFWFGEHKRTDHMEFYVFPTISVSDPTSTITSGNMGASDTSVGLASVASFLTFGFIQIDSEIMQYQSITGTTLNALLRGCCGTVAATHSNGATVQHLGFWGKGPRVPVDITSTTSIVELPIAWQTIVELYVLERCARAQQDFQGAAQYRKEFDQHLEEINADPSWRYNTGMQIPAYGQPLLGPLAYGQVIIP